MTEQSLAKWKCNCGLPGRYTMFDADGNPLVSCNKYRACLSYDDLLANHDKLQKSNTIMNRTLEKIVQVNAMDYEYKAWAKQTLTDLNNQ